jgi:hypothetical protein
MEIPEARTHRRFSVLVLAAAAAIILLPYALIAVPRGDDVSFHLSSWWQITDAWKHGAAYPQWAEMANFGFGEPRFAFYPPLSFIIGAALSHLFGLKYGLLIFVAGCLMLAGFGMLRLARRFVAPPYALAAAVLYLANPYHLLQISRRFALAELLVNALAPWLILTLVNISRTPGSKSPKDAVRTWSAGVPLAVLVALVFLTNIPSAVMACFLVVGWGMVRAASTRRWHEFGIGIGSLLLGAGIAAFHYVPMYLQLPWIQLRKIRPLDLRMELLPSLDGQFLSAMTALLVVLAVCLVFIGWKRRDALRTDLERSLFALALICTLLATVVSLPLWRYVPGLSIVQLPWRWLAWAVAFTVPLMAITLARVSSRTASLVAALALAAAVIWCGAATVYRSGSDGAMNPSFAVIRENLERGAGYRGQPEYKPASANVIADPASAQVPTVDPVTCRTSAPPTSIRALSASGDAERRTYDVEAGEAATLTLRTFLYPRWTARRDGVPVMLAAAPCGAISIALPPGRSHLEMRFAEAPGRRMGVRITLLALLALLGFYVASRRSP